MAVIVGVIGEGIAEYVPNNVIASAVTKKIGRLSWVILVAGLVAEHSAQANKDADNSLVIAALNNSNAILQQKVSPRNIDKKIFLSMLRGKQLPTNPVIISYTDGNPESNHLSITLWEVLRKAGWDAKLPTPIDEGFRVYCGGKVDDFNNGVVAILQNQASQMELMDLLKPPNDRRTPWGVLSGALTKSLMGGTKIWSVPCRGVPPDTLQVAIGPRLQQ